MGKQVEGGVGRCGEAGGWWGGGASSSAPIVRSRFLASFISTRFDVGVFLAGIAVLDEPVD